MRRNGAPGEAGGEATDYSGRWSERPPAEEAQGVMQPELKS